MGGFGLVAVAASVYLVYVLEILKFRRMDAIRLRRLRPEASAHEIDRHVARDLETGEIDAVTRLDEDTNGVVAMNGQGRAEQRIGERKMDQHRVRAEDERGDAQTPVAADGR